MCVSLAGLMFSFSAILLIASVFFSFFFNTGAFLSLPPSLPLSPPPSRSLQPGGRARPARTVRPPLPPCGGEMPTAIPSVTPAGSTTNCTM